MQDTTEGTFPEETCTDCIKVGGVVVKHWGKYIPEAQRYYGDNTTPQSHGFCAPCWEDRVLYFDQMGEAKPIGTVRLA